MRDHILILIWDIEIYSLCRLDKFSKAINKEDSVIMIYMILHWKDNSKSLKQISLIDVKTASNLY